MEDSPIHDGLSDFTTDTRVIGLSVAALAIGGISALVAYGLLWLIAEITNLAYFGRLSSASVTPAQSHLGVVSVLVPVIGGLVIGLMARYGSEKIRGHGIPEALEAILIGRSKIGAKVAILKPLSSAISIGTGGPFGAEGPIIMTGGALGSFFAQFLHLSSGERKTLLVAGAAGGMSAVFATPVAAVLLAVELLLFEWKPRSLIPVAVASTAAAAIRIPLLGAAPIFPVPHQAAVGSLGLVLAAGIGLLTGFASSGLTGLVYGFEDLFPRLKVHWMWWPAIGGLVVGFGGILDPRVLGVGYGTIHLLLVGQVLGVAALGLLFAKAVVWSMALGSGTSGGVLAPLLMMGGAIGAVVGQFLPAGSPALWAMVGMAAMMSGTMRAPFTSIVFTFELTHAVNALPALLIGGIAAEAVTVLLLKRSILTEKVARRGHHLSREYVVDPFEIHRVGEVMLRDFPTVKETLTVGELMESTIARSGWFTERRALPVMDEAGQLMGIITQGDLMRAAEQGHSEMSVLEAGAAHPVTVDEDDVLSEAVLLMLRNSVERLPVLGADGRGRMVGYIDRSAVMDARLHWYQEEHVRETPRSRGFTSRRRRRSKSPSTSQRAGGE